jgi:endonuclease/exonuclease/phosphatase family metal-dependent hydrolase
MKRLFGLALAGLLFLGIFSAPAVAGGFHRGDIVKVMTRNQYLGANLDPVVLAQSPEEFLAAATDALKTIAVNNFPLRARRLATEVALTKPDLIGLQEVFNFELNGDNPGPPFVNHLTETLDALAAKGQSYVVAATVENLDITIPIEDIGDVHVLDRDVILVREGVDFTPLTGNYDPETGTGGLCGVKIPNPAPVPPFPETLTSTPSEDGCNYTIVAQVPSPIDPDDPDETITIERGFVGVDAMVRGKTYRFVNTHLEGAQPAIIQSLQAVELVGTLKKTTPDDLPLILVGDFNSSPDDAWDNPDDNPDVPYQIIVDKGFADIWDTNPLKFFDPNGLTCCQDDDLLNTTSLLDERLDLIFIRDTSFLPLAFVTGRVPIFPLSLPPNWASDHSGVFGKLIFR